jgi:hypothetical protein
MKNYQFENAESVRDFLLYIYTRCDGPFDPAQDLRTFTSAEGKLLFSAGEGAKLEAAMQECFMFCIYNAVDLYGILQETLSHRTSFRRVA